MALVRQATLTVAHDLSSSDDVLLAEDVAIRAIILITGV
jgi:hypothetical protein